MKSFLFIFLALSLFGCARSGWEDMHTQTADFVRKKKGEPVTVISENGHKMWTYRENNCTQILFLNAADIVTDSDKICESPK